MLRYVFKRLLTAIPTLFIIVTLSFFLIRVAPGGPFDLERPLDPKVMENLKQDSTISISPCWSNISFI